MAKSTFSFVSILALLLLAAFAVFLKVDCDFFLYFAPYDPTTKPFQGQVVWITGASSGIGASLARDLSAAGAQLVLTARREDMLNLVSAECVQAGGLKPLVLAFDVTDETAQKAFYTTVKETFGRVDKLILNAGRSQRALALDTPTELSREVFDLNLFSVISLGQMVLADMVAQGGGHLVLMSSVAGLFGLPGQSTYSATKFALNGYYDALRAEYHTKNITVSVVCPGPVTSEIGDKAWKAPGYNVKEEEKKMDTERCTHLVAKGIYHKVDEMWIAYQPFLAITYFFKYFPWTSRQLNKYVMGPLRAKAMMTGGDIYDASSILGLK